MLDIKEEKIDFSYNNQPCLSDDTTSTTIKVEPSESKPCTSSSLTANRKKIKLETPNDSIKHESVVYEQCPICLSLMNNQLLARPVECKHNFCLECIEEWSKKTNTCPIDRKTYNYIIISNPLDKTFNERRKIEDKRLENNEETDFTYCEVCGACDREDTLLLCDGCDRGYHCECLNPPLANVPEGQWFCTACRGDNHNNHQNQVEESNIILNRMRTNRARNASENTRPIARTNLIERVRRVINNSRDNNSNLSHSASNIIATQILLHNFTKGKRLSSTKGPVKKRRKVVKKRKVTRRRRKTTNKTVLIKQEDGSFKSYVLKSKTTTIRKRRKVRRKAKKRKTIKTKPYAHLKKDDNIYLQTNLKMESSSDILLPADDKNGKYESYYSDFADNKPFKEKLEKEKQIKTESKDKAKEAANSESKTNSFNLLDSIFSSQNMLFKESNKIEVQKNGTISLRKEKEKIPQTLKKEVILDDAIKKELKIKNEPCDGKSCKKQLKNTPLVKIEPTTQNAKEQFKIPKIKKEPNGSTESNIKIESKIPSQVKKEESNLLNSAEMNSSELKIKTEPKSNEKIKKIENVAKVELKSYFRDRRIDKDEYKTIMKKLVSKLITSSDDEINERKIKKMIVYYVDKIKKQPIL